MSHHYLQAENLDLRRQLKFREIDWKKEKALLQQQIEQLNERLEEMEVRELQSKATIATLNRFIKDMEIKPKDPSYMMSQKAFDSRFSSAYKVDLAKSENCIHIGTTNLKGQDLRSPLQSPFQSSSLQREQLQLGFKDKREELRQNSLELSQNQSKLKSLDKRSSDILNNPISQEYSLLQNNYQENQPESKDLRQQNIQGTESYNLLTSGNKVTNKLSDQSVLLNTNSNNITNNINNNTNETEINKEIQNEINNEFLSIRGSKGHLKDRKFQSETEIFYQQEDKSDNAIMANTGFISTKHRVQKDFGRLQQDAEERALNKESHSKSLENQSNIKGQGFQEKKQNLMNNQAMASKEFDSQEYQESNQEFISKQGQSEESKQKGKKERKFIEEAFKTLEEIYSDKQLKQGSNKDSKEVVVVKDYVRENKEQGNLSYSHNQSYSHYVKGREREKDINLKDCDQEKQKQKRKQVINSDEDSIQQQNQLNLQGFKSYQATKLKKALPFSAQQSPQNRQSNQSPQNRQSEQSPPYHLKQDPTLKDLKQASPNFQQNNQENNQQEFQEQVFEGQNPFQNDTWGHSKPVTCTASFTKNTMDPHLQELETKRLVPSLEVIKGTFQPKIFRNYLNSKATGSNQTIGNSQGQQQESQGSLQDQDGQLTQQRGDHQQSYQVVKQQGTSSQSQGNQADFVQTKISTRKEFVKAPLNQEFMQFVLLRRKVLKEQNEQQMLKYGNYDKGRQQKKFESKSSQQVKNKSSQGISSTETIPDQEGHSRRTAYNSPSTGTGKGLTGIHNLSEGGHLNRKSPQNLQTLKNLQNFQNSQLLNTEEEDFLKDLQTDEQLSQMAKLFNDFQRSKNQGLSGTNYHDQSQQIQQNELNQQIHQSQLSHQNIENPLQSTTTLKDWQEFQIFQNFQKFQSLQAQYKHSQSRTSGSPVISPPLSAIHSIQRPNNGLTYDHQIPNFQFGGTQNVMDQQKEQRNVEVVGIGSPNLTSYSQSQQHSQRNFSSFKGNLQDNLQDNEQGNEQQKVSGNVQANVQSSVQSTAQKQGSVQGHQQEKRVNQKGKQQVYKDNESLMSDSVSKFSKGSKGGSRNQVGKSSVQLGKVHIDFIKGKVGLNLVDKLDFKKKDFKEVIGIQGSSASQNNETSSSKQQQLSIPKPQSQISNQKSQNQKLYGMLETNSQNTKQMFKRRKSRTNSISQSHQFNPTSPSPTSQAQQEISLKNQSNKINFTPQPFTNQQNHQNQQIQQNQQNWQNNNKGRSQPQSQVKLNPNLHKSIPQSTKAQSMSKNQQILFSSSNKSPQNLQNHYNNQNTSTFSSQSNVQQQQEITNLNQSQQGLQVQILNSKKKKSITPNHTMKDLHTGIPAHLQDILSQSTQKNIQNHQIHQNQQNPQNPQKQWKDNRQLKSRVSQGQQLDRKYQTETYNRQVKEGSCRGQTRNEEEQDMIKGPRFHSFVSPDKKPDWGNRDLKRQQFQVMRMSRKSSQKSNKSQKSYGSVKSQDRLIERSSNQRPSRKQRLVMDLDPQLMKKQVQDRQGQIDVQKMMKNLQKNTAN